MESLVAATDQQRTSLELKEAASTSFETTSISQHVVPDLNHVAVSDNETYSKCQRQPTDAPPPFLSSGVWFGE